MTVKLTVTHEYSGLGDYWGGNGRRWDDNAGCLFAFYGAGTTLRDCVDQWVNEFCAGGDCDSLPDEVTEDDVRNAILAALTDQGRADYESGAVAECAVEYAEINGFDGEEDEDEFDESPIWVILVECEVCSECGKADEHAIDDICAECAAKHDYPESALRR